MGAHNLCSTQMIIVWIWGFLGFISKVDTVYLELTCPQFFKEGISNIVTCKINQAALSSVCSTALGDVEFNYIKPDTTLESECRTPNLQNSNTCSSTISQGINSSCLCAQKNGDMFTYELRFIGSRAQHEGITLQCIICFPQNAVDQNISASCNNIKFDSPVETTTGGASTGGASTGGASTDGTSTGPPKWIPAPIILGCAAIVVIIFSIFHWALGCKCCGKKGCVPCCKETDKPVSKCVNYVSCEHNSCCKTKPSIRKP